jgi:hypothetical protein
MTRIMQHAMARRKNSEVCRRGATTARDVRVRQALVVASESNGRIRALADPPRRMIFRASRRTLKSRAHATFRVLQCRGTPRSRRLSAATVAREPISHQEDGRFARKYMQRAPLVSQRPMTGPCHGSPSVRPPPRSRGRRWEVAPGPPSDTSGGHARGGPIRRRQPGRDA